MVERYIRVAKIMTSDVPLRRTTALKVQFLRNLKKRLMCGHFLAHFMAELLQKKAPINLIF